MFNGLNVAVYQGQPIRGDIEANICVIDAVLKECALKKVDLCLFPELFISGYDLCQEEFHSIALSVGTDFAFLSHVARECKCAIAVGYPELGDDGSCYNSCILIDDSGNIALNYRKTHLWDPENVHEKVIFTPGNDLVTANLRVARLETTISVGILICFDCEFPEPARILALMGIKLLLIPTAIADSVAEEASASSSGVNIPDLPGDLTPTVMVPSRAMENHIFVLYANLVGSCCLVSSPSKPNPRFCGQSAIIAPTGVDICRSSRVGTGLLTAQLSYSEYETSLRRNNYFANRRPELYTALSTNGMVADSAYLSDSESRRDRNSKLCTMN